MHFLFCGKKRAQGVFNAAEKHSRYSKDIFHNKKSYLNIWKWVKMGVLKNDDVDVTTLFTFCQKSSHKKSMIVLH